MVLVRCWLGLQSLEGSARAGLPRWRFHVADSLCELLAVALRVAWAPHSVEAGFRQGISRGSVLKGRRKWKLPSQLSTVSKIGQHRFCHNLLVKADTGPS